MRGTYIKKIPDKSNELRYYIYAHKMPLVFLCILYFSGDTLKFNEINMLRVNVFCIFMLFL